MIRFRTSVDPRRGAQLLLVLLAITTACGPLRRGPEREQTVLTFTNESTTQADVFAQTPGGLVRLGTVYPNKTEEFRLPENVMLSASGGLNVIARLLPSRASVETGALTVVHGDRFLVRLPAAQNLLVVTPMTTP